MSSAATIIPAHKMSGTDVMNAHASLGHYCKFVFCIVNIKHVLKSEMIGKLHHTDYVIKYKVLK